MERTIDAENNMFSWDQYFMQFVYLAASKSKDHSTHVGAVIVGPDREIRSTGYNSFVRGINDDLSGRQDRPEKYFWFEHAERNAIYNTARMGLSIKDCVMYTNGVPCMDCARGIVQSGIKEVVVDEEWEDNKVEPWAEHVRRSLQLFEEAGVAVRYVRVQLNPLCKFKRGETL